MIEVRFTDDFSHWLRKLSDIRARGRIIDRIERLEHGNAGDVKAVGGGVREMRIDYGPGYRVYYFEHGSLVVVLLCGGDKRTQQKDIRRAQAMAEGLKQ